MMRESSLQIIRVVRELSRTYEGVFPWQVAPEVGYTERQAQRRMGQLAEKGLLERVGCDGKTKCRCRKGYKASKTA